jgi:hypothetical protein
MNSQPMQNSPQAPKNTPTWWTERHSSAWERVKDAFRRDWMQTKSDFSVGDAKNLNQRGGDTLVQAAGTAPMPAADAKTRGSNPQDSARDAARALEHMTEVTRRSEDHVADARRTIDEQRQKLSAKLSDIQDHTRQSKLEGDRKIMDATQQADAAIGRAQGKIADATADRERAEGSWRQAEREARFGYTVRMQHPNEAWGDSLDMSLRAEWESMGDARSWEEARPGVRSGWEYARSTL